MRRMGILAAALSVTLVTIALGAGAEALATTPEWYECIKQSGGSYQKFCGAEGGKGGYIAKPGVGSASLVIRTGKLNIGSPRNPIACAAALKGTKQMPNLLVSATLVMSGCHRVAATNQHCAAQEEKLGPKERQFESEPVEGELGYISRSPLKVGLRVAPTSGSSGIIFPRIYCVSPPEHFLLRGSFVGEVLNAVNVSSGKMKLSYVPGHYLGEGQPEVDPPLEGEEAGTLIEEIHTTGEEFGMPEPAALSGTQTAVGSQMIKA